MGIARKIFGQRCLQLRNGECHAPAKSTYKIGWTAPSCNGHLTASQSVEARAGIGVTLGSEETNIVLAN